MWFSLPSLINSQFFFNLFLEMILELLYVRLKYDYSHDYGYYEINFQK